MDRERLIAVRSGNTSPPSSILPYLEDRLGVCDVYGKELPDGTHDLVIRASFRFPYWPLGEWVVFDGVQSGSGQQLAAVHRGGGLGGLVTMPVF